MWFKISFENSIIFTHFYEKSLALKEESIKEMFEKWWH